MSITGHSRNGKQSLIAAAFDDRITSVVGSSPGTPVAAPVRFSSPDFNGETVDSVSSKRDWWLPSLKTYFVRGRASQRPLLYFSSFNRVCDLLLFCRYFCFVFFFFLLLVGIAGLISIATSQRHTGQHASSSSWTPLRPSTFVYLPQPCLPCRAVADADVRALQRCPRQMNPCLESKRVGNTNFQPMVT